MDTVNKDCAYSQQHSDIKLKELTKQSNSSHSAVVLQMRKSLFRFAESKEHCYTKVTARESLASMTARNALNTYETVVDLPENTYATVSIPRTDKGLMYAPVSLLLADMGLMHAAVSFPVVDKGLIYAAVSFPVSRQGVNVCYCEFPSSR